MRSVKRSGAITAFNQDKISNAIFRTLVATQMFERVAILVGIGDVLYDSKVFEKTGNITQDIEEARTYLEKLDNFDYKFKIGEYFLNKWHFRSLINHYVTLASKGQINPLSTNVQSVSLH